MYELNIPFNFYFFRKKPEKKRFGYIFSLAGNKKNAEDLNDSDSEK
jgi:hypothetical protein